MINLLLSFLILAVAIYLIAAIFPGIKVRSFGTALAVSVVYSLLNFVLFKLLIFITFPLVILKVMTLGLFGIVINAVLLIITDRMLDDFKVSSIGAALLAAVGISGVNLLLRMLIF